MGSSRDMAGRSNTGSSDSTRRPDAPELHIVRCCPLCNELMEFDPQSSPQVVVCDSCGLACTVDVAPQRPTLDIEDFAIAPPAASDHDDAVHWLQKSPGPILPAPDFAAKQASARRRQLALAGGVASTAALAIAMLSGYFGYHTASDKLALQQQTVESRQQAETQRLLEQQQRLELQRTDAEAKRLAAQRDVRAVTAKYLAAQSQELAAVEPWRSVSVSTNAIRSTLDVDGIVLPEAHQSLRDSLLRCSGSHDIDAIELRGHAGPITTLAVSPDGRWLATGSVDRTARIWDLQADHPQRTANTLNIHQKPVTSILFSNDGKSLITGSRDATACVWSLGIDAPAAIPVILPGRSQPISQLALSPNGDWLAAVSTEAGADIGLGQLWNLAGSAGKATSMALTGHAGQIQAMAISPDNHWLALGVDDAVKLWDLTARDPAAASIERQCRHGNVTAILFSNDGRWLVTCGAGREPAVRLWNLTSRDASESLLLKGLDGPVRAAAVSADSRYLVAAGDDQRLRVWNLQGVNAETEPTLLPLGAAKITAVAVSKAGDWLAASDASGKVFLWRVNFAGVEPQPVVLTASDKALNALAFTADGRWLAAAGDDWTARLWNLDIAQLAGQAEVLAKVQLETAQQVSSQSLLESTLAVLDPRELTEATTTGLIWSAVEWHAPRVQANWKVWMQDRLAVPEVAPAPEPQMARGPRLNELGEFGDVDMPSIDPAPQAAPIAEPSILPTPDEKPSLVVAPPESEDAKPRPALNHEWPVRSIVKRHDVDAEPRTAARPASTLEIR
ncbi:WD40 repeat domain-containing protein [Lacipirellula sp.]|uniref:WD40 repeat domain-containing protein n=1 Tax=Lacipirellula sp. TaxID=2691419 RepID=UPI003D0A419E